MEIEMKIMEFFAFSNSEIGKNAPDFYLLRSFKHELYAGIYFLISHVNMFSWPVSAGDRNDNAFKLNKRKE